MRYCLKKSSVLKLFVLFLFWSVVAFFMPAYILPSPVEVGRVFWNEITMQSLILSCFFSFLRIFLGLLFSFLLGIVFGCLLGFNDMARKHVRSLFIVLQVTPIISWILLALIWFSQQFIPIFIIMISTLPTIVFAFEQEISNAKKHWMGLQQIYDIAFLKALRKIYAPSIKQNLTGIISVVLGLAIKAGVMSEVIVRMPSGIGAQMEIAQRNIDTSAIFGWTILIIMISILLDSKTRGYVKQ